MKRIVVNIGYVFSMISGFLSDMRAQKKRTVLTIFGIVWGTAAVVIMMALGTSTRRQNLKNFRGLGDGIILVFNGTTTKPYQGFGVDRGIRMEKADVEILRREIPEIDNISEEFSSWSMYLRYRDKLRNPMVAGVNVEYSDMRSVFPRPGGRFFNRLDMDNRRRVVFLGNELKDFLFGEQVVAVGKLCEINGVPFRVIGVLKDKTQNSSYNSRDMNRAYIPSTTFQAITGNRHITNLVVTHRMGMANSRYVVNRIREVLGKKYMFDSTDESALHIWDTAEFFDEFMLFFSAFNVFLVIMGAVTLGVGGLGVSNIMYVVVRERSREIGIRRSVGARRWAILLQFFAETFFIVFIGAAIGFVLAWGIISVAAFFPEGVKEALGTPVIDPLVVLVSVLVISMVGFLAGFFPARRASRLDPVECLSY
jgi:putative ABC transport system permease protein